MIEPQGKGWTSPSENSKSVKTKAVRLPEMSPELLLRAEQAKF